MLARISFVLVEPQRPGNIGSCARALANMGLARLVLVSPPDHLGGEARRMAMGGSAVLEQARVEGSLKQALAEAGLVIGTTRRAGKNRGPLVGIDIAAARAIEMARAGNDVAMVFGREDSGLTTEELDSCGLLATIPADPSYPSLNLAQAVLVAAYELRRAAAVEAGPEPRSLAPAADVEAFFEQLAETLDAIGFLNPQNPEEVMHALRRLFGRAALEPREVRILRGILSQTQWAVGRRAPERDPADGR
jgi:TrmH family RNA methyltransferase